MDVEYSSGLESSQADSGELQRPVKDAAKMRLISLCRQRPLLWNSKLADHSNRGRVSAAIQEIATQMGPGWNALKVRTQWNNVRSYYLAIRRARPTGSAAEEHRPDWWLYDELSFLNDLSEPRDSLTNVSCPLSCFPS
jgi:hypothetical protein